ncbi:MAG: DUF763 domain-containing protein [Nitrososphaerota archaeon]|nr:DUF763 domain-containing protein [Nitrososphaerota archaeon]
MERSGVADLPLHEGKAPRWLIERMKALSSIILRIMYDEYGYKGILVRISDPFWFQSLACVLGYDWDSSGTTTVLCGVLKSVLSSQIDVGIRAVGGKGSEGRRAQDEILEICKIYGFSDEEAYKLRYASRLTAKVDNAAIQDGYKIYHHTMFVCKDGGWAVVQQGMDEDLGWARRYHWISDRVRSFVVEPHEAIVGDGRHSYVLNMVAYESEGCRRASVDLACENPSRLRRILSELSLDNRQKTIEEILGLNMVERRPQMRLKLNPESVNWDALKAAYRVKPSSYEELLALKGVGPATVRGLALLSQIIYGEPPSWRDPVKYCFAFGGKDGIPFPILRRVYDEVIAILDEAYDKSKLGDREKLEAFKRLSSYMDRLGLR